MRLIHTSSFELEEFIPPITLGYAILSHTWEAGEVTFQDMSDLSEARQKPGLNKIRLMCDQARQDGLEYAWADTCCIDKSSSADLSEAINSMFTWYKAAAVCYVYISERQTMDPRMALGVRNFESCRWFTRGWTLQELITPRVVRFFDWGWKPIGSRETLRASISRATSIDEDILSGRRSFSSTPVANRMAWASRRTTTRTEDVAYCLLGIFDINMPIIYGEGPKAFMRLQEEILKSNMDLTLFAWQALPRDDQPYRGVFARSPLEFADCHAIVVDLNQFHFSGRVQPSNKGVHFAGLSLQSYRASQQLASGMVLPLRCHDWRLDRGRNADIELGIMLRHSMRGWVRVCPSRLFDASYHPVNVDAPEFRMKTLVTDFSAMRDVDNASIQGCLLDEEDSFIQFNFNIKAGLDYVPTMIVPEELWDPFALRFMTARLPALSGMVEFDVGVRQQAVSEFISFAIAFHVGFGSRTANVTVSLLKPEKRLSSPKVWKDRFGEQYILLGLDGLAIQHVKESSGDQIYLSAGLGIRVTARISAEENGAGDPARRYSVAIDISTIQNPQ